MFGKRKQPGRENSHYKIGFEEMGKVIGQRWQELDCDVQQKYEARVQAEK